MSNTITVLSPGTVANMVCGFDILGFAVHQPTDRMTLSLVNRPGVHIAPDPVYNLPTEPEKNVAGAALPPLLEDPPPGGGFSV